MYPESFRCRNSLVEIDICMVKVSTSVLSVWVGTICVLEAQREEKRGGRMDLLLQLELGPLSPIAIECYCSSFPGIQTQMWA